MIYSNHASVTIFIHWNVSFGLPCVAIQDVSIETLGRIMQCADSLLNSTNSFLAAQVGNVTKNTFNH